MNAENVSNDFLSVDQIAQFMGTTRAGAYKMMERKLVPSVKIGRRILVPLAAWENFVSQRAQTALANVETLSHAA